jgi:hypothetical protein
VLLFLDASIWLREHEGSNDSLLVDIQASATGVNYLHLLLLSFSGQRKVRTSHNVPMRAHPLRDGDIPLFWAHLDQLLGRAPRFKNGDDLCSLTSPILSHFHLPLCPQRHGAFGGYSSEQFFDKDC